MFFILSKVLNFLIMPFTMVCLLFLLSGVVRNQRWKKRFFWLAFGSLLFFSNDFISNEMMNMWEIETIAYKDMKPHDLGIVLTGATLPLLKPDDRVYFQRGADRVTHTVQLYKLGLLKKIMISGGSGRLTGDDEPEADKFKKAMVMMGVSEMDIFIENETRNTYGNLASIQSLWPTSESGALLQIGSSTQPLTRRVRFDLP